MVTVEGRKDIKFLDVGEKDDKVMNSDSNSVIETNCCVPCSNKNVMRACFKNNIELLKECINDHKHIGGLMDSWGPEMKWIAIDYAFYHGNMKMVDLLLDYDEKKWNVNRVVAEPYLLQSFDTGEVSDHTYGMQIRKVNVSRGNRKGNNAFLEEPKIEQNTFRSYLRTQ
jgi:hypothetical protein